MKIDFTVKRNVEKGVSRYRKAEDQKGNQRLTFLMTKKQRSILFDYCNEKGLYLSEVIRIALNDYFEKVGYVIPPDPVEDKRQLKMFDQPKEPDQPE